jgi:trehalose/maltose transport system permease protein
VNEGQTSPAVVERAGPRRRGIRGGSLEARTARLAWLLLVPSLLVVALVALYPMVSTIVLSFTDTTFGKATSHFVGLRNYQQLLQDAGFRHSILVTVEFTVLTVAFEAVLGMIVALVVNSQFRGRGMMRAAMLIPWAIITVISANMWKLMYNQIYGVFNDLAVYRLHLLSQPLDFLGNPGTALASVAAIDIWKTTPFVALILLAGLQVIPHDLYEAAEVDGAGAVRRFLSVTLPLLQPALLVALVFRTMDALRVFDVFYVLFGGRADTMSMAGYVQQNVVDFGKVGYGSTISVAVLIILGIFVAAYVTANRAATVRQ